MILVFYQRCIQKRKANRELAESIEDARIYASSRENAPVNGNPNGGVYALNHMPVDQMSTVSSHQSSLLTAKPTQSQISLSPSSMVSGYSTQHSQQTVSQIIEDTMNR